MTQLLERLEKEWSIAVKEAFIEKLDKRVNLVRAYPNLFPKSLLKKGLHKCVVSKQTSFFYIHDINTITILTIFDNRQDPKNVNKQLDDDEI